MFNRIHILSASRYYHIDMGLEVSVPSAMLSKGQKIQTGPSRILPKATKQQNKDIASAHYCRPTSSGVGKQKAKTQGVVIMLKRESAAQKKGTPFICCPHSLWQKTPTLPDPKTNAVAQCSCSSASAIEEVFS